jgi:hypothetical protein
MTGRNGRANRGARSGRGPVDHDAGRRVDPTVTGAVDVRPVVAGVIVVGVDEPDRRVIDLGNGVVGEDVAVDVDRVAVIVERALQGVDSVVAAEDALELVAARDGGARVNRDGAAGHAAEDAQHSDQRERFEQISHSEFLV